MTVAVAAPPQEKPPSEPQIDVLQAVPTPASPPPMSRPEPVVRSPEQAQINGQAEAACRGVGDFIRNENVSGLEQCLWDRGYRQMIESALPPGRTVAEQREINDRAVFRCGASNTECQQELGYIQLTRGPTPAESYLEGNILAAVVVILGGLWLAIRVWVWLFASRSAYRYITKPRE